MEAIMDQLQHQDKRIVDIFRKEEIDDIETFLSLDENDFTRLKMTTKMIKIVQKLQNHLQDCNEEWIVEEVEISPTNTQTVNADDTPQNVDPNDPYKGISLDNVIDIDTIFEKTNEGITIMEVLKEGLRPKESTFKKINDMLCDCLKSVYGCRPNRFYKDQIAISLVKSYPILAAKDAKVPQALWFHAHARGPNRHAGRIHYRMEYLARTSGERVIKRRRTEEQQTEPQAIVGSDATRTEDGPPSNIEELILELQYIVPNQHNKHRVLELWKTTFSKRQQSRDADEFQQYLQAFPVSTAYDGELITFDFQILKPAATSFADEWNKLEGRILTVHRAMYRELTNDFVRALAIVRFKNSSRGSKRAKTDDAVLNNPLSGVVKWIQPEDDFPQDSGSIPLLVVRGNFPDVTDGCAVCWGTIAIPVGDDLKTAFGIFIQCFPVFGVALNPSDKNFFLFIGGAVLNINTLTTTGAKFLHGLQ
ncbi:uncharacterized protein LOC135712957 [Ochlerotatus camptorhynchus]|uniref:uncharacterized protein LOC135712957 n=1 Tax=Ochlerotatus camptorhynchus TaxID=644619 RepID=UPI0031E2F055